MELSRSLLWLLIPLFFLAIILVFLSSDTPDVVAEESVDVVQASDAEHDSLLCLEGDLSCNGGCGTDSSDCGRECVASSGQECNCGSGVIPNSNVITCDQPPSIL